MSPIKKKTAARYKRVARRYESWLHSNPGALRKRRIREFDAICDAEYNQEMNERYERVGEKLLTAISNELERPRNS